MTTHLFTLIGSGNEVAALATTALLRAGLKVVRSFDLNSARAVHAECNCPHHGTALCDCHLIMLLVYGEEDAPVTMSIHGRDGYAQLVLVDDLAQRPSPKLETLITDVLDSAFLSHARLEILS